MIGASGRTARCFLFFLVFFFLSGSAFAFTLSTQLADPERTVRDDITSKLTELIGVTTPQRQEAALKAMSFSIDASGFRDYHSRYIFNSGSYWPKLLDKDGSVVEDDPEVKLTVHTGDGVQLNCSPFLNVGGFGLSGFRKVGDVTRCDFEQAGNTKNGIMEYRIDAITGPAYKKSVQHGWGPFKVADNYALEGSSTTVQIDFSIRLRNDDGVGEPGFSEWVSTLQELQALEGLGGTEAGTDDSFSLPQGTCTPVIGKIFYQGTEYAEPDVFNYLAYGQEFSVLAAVREDCDVSAFALGFWESAELSGLPGLEVEFLPWEAQMLDLHGYLFKDIVLSEAPYPEKMYLAGTLANAAGETFNSAPVEFHFPGSSGGNGGNGTTQGVAGCNPCISVAGCFACIDHLLVKGSFE